jgi:ERF superfamily
MTDLQVHGPTALGHDPVTGLAVVPPTTDVSPEGLIALAIQRGVPVETFEKLLAMHQQLRAAAAKREFDEAFARVQSELPVICKSSDVIVDGKKRYSYAPIDRIIAIVQPILTKHGFSYSFDSIDEADPPAKVCVMTMRHAGGHSERSSFRIEIDQNGRQNKSQQHASAHTYAKRYAFCDGWGIMTGEEDDDSRKASEAHPKLREGDTTVKLKPDPAPKETRKATSTKGSAATSGTITSAQLDLLRDRAAQLAQSYHVATEAALQVLIDHCGREYGVAGLDALSPAQCTELLGWMLAKRRAKTMNAEATL